MKYQDYSVEDFVKDEFFVNWVKNKHAESDHYWRVWIQNNPEKLETVNAAISIINSIDYKRKNELSELEYAEIFEKVIKDDQHNSGYRLGKPFVWHKLVAAIFVPLLIGALSYFYFYHIETPALQTRYLSKSNPLGVKSTFKLSDGTEVKLNAGGSLRFPEEFSTDQRMVYLDGEAFFHVVRDEGRPFLVVTDEVVTKVLGTSFNVKNNLEDHSVEVALVTGKVSVSDQNGNSFVLQPAEMATFAWNNIGKKQFNADLVIGWTQNKLVFAKESDREVISKLEKWYGVKFILQDGYMFKERYTGVFENESLENVLKGIAYTSHFTYEIRDETVIITH